MLIPQRLLVAVDLEGRAIPAAHFGAALARDFSGDLAAIHILQPTQHPWLLDMPVIQEGEAELRHKAESVLRPQLPAGCVLRCVQGHPVKGVLDAVEERRADLLILGPPHTGVLDRVLGSTGLGILRRSSVPVLVHRDAGTALPSRIVLGMDLSTDSERALAVALSWARALRVPLEIVYVFEPPVFCYTPGGAMPTYAIDSIREAEDRRLEQILCAVDFEGVSHEVTRAVGAPRSVLADLLEERPGSLAVVGSHGRSGFDRLFLGSVSESVVRNAPGSVLVVRHAAP